MIGWIGELMLLFASRHLRVSRRFQLSPANCECSFGIVLTDFRTRDSAMPGLKSGSYA